MTGPESEGSQVRRAVCPGSFDPITNGHLDIIARASRLYDEVYVAVMINQSKKGLFEIEERIDLIRRVTAEYGNVRVEAFHGLLVDFCKQRDIPAIVKGLRAVSDFDYELQMAQMNNGLSGVETLFVPTNPTYSFLSSSLVKEVAAWGEPDTPEGWAVRYADKIAYLHHDVDDAVRAGIIDDDAIPKEVRASLGSTREERLDTMIYDVIVSSSGASAIRATSYCPSVQYVAVTVTPIRRPTSRTASARWVVSRTARTPCSVKCPSTIYVGMTASCRSLADGSMIPLHGPPPRQIPATRVARRPRDGGGRPGV